MIYDEAKRIVSIHILMQLYINSICNNTPYLCTQYNYLSIWINNIKGSYAKN